MAGTDEVAKRVAALRARLALTQEEFARRAQIERTQVTKLEHGTNQATSHAIRTGLALVAGVTRDVMDEYLAGTRTLDDVMALARAAPAHVVVRGASQVEGAAVRVVPAEVPILGSEWERALVPALDPRKHTLEDLDAVRAALRSTRQLTREAADPKVLAADLLDAAASLREEGIPVSPLEVFVRAAVRAEHTIREAREAAVCARSEELNGNGDKELHAIGGAAPDEPARPPKKRGG